MTAAVLWFRKDLRLTDNPAWAAATGHDRVLPLFVIDPALWDRCTTERVALLAGHLRALDRSLQEMGGRLTIATGDPADVVPAVAERVGADVVVVNADVSPYSATRDAAVAAEVPVEWHHGSLVHPPGSILTTSGTRYRMFTPFSHRWFDTPLPAHLPPGDASLTADPGDGIPATEPPAMEPGEDAALARLEGFDPDTYQGVRDRPDIDGTSRLSVDLKYGTLGARTVVDAIGTASASRKGFVRQLAWRDFHAHLMEETPGLVDTVLKPGYDDIGWRDDPAGLAAWKEGRTGYPIVDAGMRQLRGEGWIHNRVRMIAASFLVKDLLIDWRSGERWFRRHLLDGDVSQNVGNWQWVAGSGADAAPYFRIFNPITQSRRFDPDGGYIRRWVPELRDVPAPAVHAPWETGGSFGHHRDPNAIRYPDPIVDHAAARAEALEAYSDALGG